VSARYEWRESEDGSKDLLFRDELQIGEVSGMGQLWVSAVLRPSKVKEGIDDRSESVKGAVIGRDKARAMTLRQARFFWDGVSGVDEVEALGGGLGA
jgi:hypothetical protein